MNIIKKLVLPIINKKQCLFLYLCSVLLFNFLKTDAQVKEIGYPEIKNFLRKEYRGSTQNWNIDQDKNGNMYFANNDGLLQFDGINWNQYKLPNKSSIRAVKIDKSGKIFVGGYNEFGFFEANESGKLIYTSISKLLKQKSTKPIDFVWKIHFFNGEIIFQTFENLYSFKNNSVTIISAPNRFQFSFIANSKLYLQDIKNGLLTYQNNHLSSIANTTSLNNTEIWGMLPISKDSIVIATLDKGLFLFSKNVVSKWNTKATIFLEKNSSLGGTTLGEKYLVFNSVLDGVVLCDKKGEIIQHINRKKGLQNNTILASFIDSKNNLWLGLDNGISFINENSSFTYFGSNAELGTVYSSVVYNNKLYVATNQGVFYHELNTNSKDEIFKLVTASTGQAWNIQVINNLLICAHNRGAMIINNDVVTSIEDHRGYWGFKSIPGTNYFIGSNYNGFALFEKSNKTIIFKTQLDGIDKASNAFFIEKNMLWIIKDNLVYRLSLSSDKTHFENIKSFKTLSNKTNGIITLQNLNGKLYFQSNNYFFRYSYDENIFFEDKKMSKLFNDLPKVKYINQDNQGNIWYAFGQSLGVLMKVNNHYQNSIGAFSNLTGNLVNNYVSINSVDKNNFYIGLTEGLAHYNGKIISEKSNQPKAFIRSFSTPSDTLLFGNGKEWNEKIKILYKNNNVKFTFASPSYENLKNIEFSYFLEGFDEQWSQWSSLYLKEYTNLKEGNYIMKLKVRDSYGIVSEVKSIQFTVNPPWYRTLIAYFFYIVGIILCIVTIRKRMKMKIRKNKYYETIEQRKIYLEKEAKIKQEQFELETEIERLKNEKLQIKILAKDKELVNNSLQVVKKNKILNGIIQKIKDLDSESFNEVTKFQITKLNKSIVKEVNADKSWKDLEKHIKNVHFDFLKRLKEKYPTISPRELDLSTYLLMNMSTKEIAEIMNISNGGVELARYRLRKKLDLNKKENL
ncbi:triple tyrosine motif-containing protein, partial [Flavobacterium sp.]|uniref:triple tyrosine motif-containing protein n=1 Tax=Flavobacterium sp. TaxID=239 RepID=UPI00375111F3